jgi:mRNA-degrading endonuclease toxin of MazEF toxin-antitoxin module
VKAWEIYFWQAPGWPEPPPAVIISEDSGVANKPQVNVLLCSTKPVRRDAGPTEVILDTADGLDWSTLCKCDLIYSVDKAALSTCRGVVTFERRRQIARKVVQCLAFANL